MAREAVTDTVTGAVKRIGREGFAASDDFDGATESVVALNDTTDFTLGVLEMHHKVVAGVLTVMSGGEQAAVDAVFPTILTHRSQFVKETRDPTIDDDLDKGIFPGCRWLRQDTTDVFWNRTNTTGAATWDKLADGAPSVIEFISFAKDSAASLPTSPTILAFNQTIEQSTSAPFTHDGAGTFTAVRTGTFQFDAEMNWILSSGTTTNRLMIEIYFSTGGAYVILPAETTTAASPSRSRLYRSQLQDGYVLLSTVVAVTSGHTFRLYAWTDGSSSGTSVANMQRIHFREMKNT